MNAETEIRQLRNELAAIRRERDALARKFGQFKGRALIVLTYRHNSRRANGGRCASDSIQTWFVDDPAEDVRSRNRVLEFGRALEKSLAEQATTCEGGTAFP